MADLMIALGTVGIVVVLEVLAWFMAFDSRDSSPREQTPVVGPGHRPTWF
jgi:hypothetical protein